MRVAEVIYDKASTKAVIGCADALEKEAFSKAYDNLAYYDKAMIHSLALKAVGQNKNGYKIKNFGDAAALELMAKLGIWLNANVPKRISLEDL